MNEIKELRKKAGLTQDQLSQKYGIPLNTIKNWECSPDKLNHRNCPAYVKELLKRVIREDYKDRL